MMYCVCQNKDGEMFIQSRAERENMLSVLMDIEQAIPTFVIKTFDNEVEAKLFVVEQQAINSLIDKTLNQQ